MDAIPSPERSYIRLLLLLNMFRTRGAVFLGLAWFAIASHSQKRRVLLFPLDIRLKFIFDSNNAGIGGN